MKIMERGQVTIPKKYWDLYGIRPGNELEMVAIRKTAKKQRSNYTQFNPGDELLNHAQ